MTKSGLLATGSMAALLAATPAGAATYITFFGGANWTDDLGGVAGGGGQAIATRATHIDGTSAFGATYTRPITFNFNAATTFALRGANADTGYVVGAAVGWDMPSIMSGLRGEIEVSFRGNDLNGGSLAGGGTATDTAVAGPFFASFVGDRACSPSGVVGVAPKLAPVSGCQGLSGLSTGTSLTYAATNAATFAAGHLNGNVKTWAIMANVWYDFAMDSRFTPYVGVGIGLAHSEVSLAPWVKGEDDSFAWQAGVGVNYALDKQASVGIGYRYMDAGSIDVNVTTPFGAGATFDYDVTHSSVLINFTMKPY